MRIQPFNSFKNICKNYVPFISQGYLLATLFKNCISPIEESQKLPGYTLLAQGSIGRTIVLMIPILGNLIVFVCDLIRQYKVNQVTKDGVPPEDLCNLFQNDPEIMAASELRAFYDHADLIGIALESDNLPVQLSPEQKASIVSNFTKGLARLIEK